MDIDTYTKEASRRNLTILSIGFILFSLGDAQFADQAGKTTVSILSSSVTFHNPNLLINFAWIMQFWFLLRFWQFSDHKKDWISYTKEIYESNLMSKWLHEKHQSRSSNTGNTYIGEGYQPVFGVWEWPASKGNTENGGYQVKSYDFIKKLHLVTYVAVKTEKFGQFYVPYILAFSAIVITLYKYYFL